MLVNQNTKAAKCLKNTGADPVYDAMLVEIEKRAELVGKPTQEPFVYEFSDGSQLEVIPSRKIARVIKNAN